ncbi:MAG: 50S ribosomal protein L21 [Clostridia bacterium]|nr:50S ribosomal protein L21 [Clostridia bacterium]
MYAIISTGGKQYKVTEGERIDVEKLNAQPDDTVNFDVLLFADEEGKIETGNPVLENVKCEAKVIEQRKEAKIVVFKYKAKKNVRKKKGHRQPYTRVKIVSIKKA